MQAMRNLAGRFGLLAVVGLAVGMLCAPTALAGPPLIINVHIDGVAGVDGSGNYSASSYLWGESGGHLAGASPQISFSQSLGLQALENGNVVLELMKAVAAHQAAPTADVQVVCEGSQAVVFLDYHMVNAHFESITDRGLDPTIYPQQPVVGTSPFESVTLRFKRLVYTWQPILPNCQKNGPPVTYTWKF